MTMKSHLTAILFVLFFPSWVAAQEGLRFGNFSPEFKHRPSHAIIKEAYKRLHIDIELLYLPAERSLWAANNDIIDGDVARIIGMEKEYPNLLRVKIPVTHTVLYACVKNITFKVEGWQSLKPYRIVHLRGAKLIENNLKNFHTETVTTIEQAFTMLEHGRVDVVVAAEITEELRNYPNIKALMPELYSFPVYHYLNKKHANLIAPLEAILTEMIADKTIENLEHSFTKSP